MAASVDEIQSPLRLLDEMTVITQSTVGNTPRPDSSIMLMISGISHIDNKDYEGAEIKVKLSLKAAEEALKDPKSTKSDHEQLAVVLSVLGFLDTLRGFYEPAIESYKHSLTIWEQLLGKNSTKLAHFLIDFSLVYSLAEKLDESSALLERSRILLHSIRTAEAENATLIVTSRLAGYRNKQKRYHDVLLLLVPNLDRLEKEKHPEFPHVLKIYFEALQAETKLVESKLKLHKLI